MKLGGIGLARRWVGLALCLGGWAVAGGGGSPMPITPGSVLQSLTGVTVTEAPTGSFEVDSARWMTGIGYTYAAQVQVGPEQVRVLLAPGAIEDSSTVNSLLAFVETTTPAASQRQALIHVARGFLQSCAPQLATQARPVWPELARRDWAAALGWQDQMIGSVQVGWSGREGLNGVAGKFAGKSAGLNVTWPRSSGRCVF